MRRVLYCSPPGRIILSVPKLHVDHVRRALDADGPHNIVIQDLDSEQDRAGLLVSDSRDRIDSCHGGILSSIACCAVPWRGRRHLSDALRRRGACVGATRRRSCAHRRIGVTGSCPRWPRSITSPGESKVGQVQSCPSAHSRRYTGGRDESVCNQVCSRDALQRLVLTAKPRMLSWTKPNVCREI